MPLLEQLRREVAKSDPTGAYAGITYDLTARQQPVVGLDRAKPDALGPSRRRSAVLCARLQDLRSRCPAADLQQRCRLSGGGVCGTIWSALPGRASARRKVCFGHSDAMLAGRARSDRRCTAPRRYRRPAAGARHALPRRVARGLQRTGAAAAGRSPSASSSASIRRTAVDAAAFLTSLTSELRDIPGNRLTISVAAMQLLLVVRGLRQLLVERTRRSSPSMAARRWSAATISGRRTTLSAIRCTICRCVHGPGRGQRVALRRSAVAVCLHQPRQEARRSRRELAGGQSCRPAPVPRRSRRRPCRGRRPAACRSWRSAGWPPASPGTSPTRASSRAI